MEYKRGLMPPIVNDRLAPDWRFWAACLASDAWSAALAVQASLVTELAAHNVALVREIHRLEHELREAKRG